jgi:hypothetical protein
VIQEPSVIGGRKRKKGGVINKPWPCQQIQLVTEYHVSPLLLPAWIQISKPLDYYENKITLVHFLWFTKNRSVIIQKNLILKNKKSKNRAINRKIGRFTIFHSKSKF